MKLKTLEREMAETGGGEEQRSKRRRIDEWCSAVEKQRQALVIVGEYLHNLLNQSIEEKKVIDARLQVVTEENRALDEQLKQTQEQLNILDLELQNLNRTMKLVEERRRFGEEINGLYAKYIKEVLEIGFQETQKKKMIEMKGQHRAQMESLMLQHKRRIQEIQDHNGGEEEE